MSRERTLLQRVRPRLHQRGRTLVSEDFKDTEDLDGLFSGWKETKRSTKQRPGATTGASTADAGGTSRPGVHTPSASRHFAREKVKPAQTIQRSNTRVASFRYSSAIFSATRRRWSSRSAAFPRINSPVADNALQELRPRAHHCLLLRRRLDAAHRRRADDPRGAILQLLLGNIGRPGGGILALRGHATIQGSTDIPDTLQSSARLHSHAESKIGYVAEEVHRCLHAAFWMVDGDSEVHRLATEGLV
jgi:formate dehydrogenase major subunit